MVQQIGAQRPGGRTGRTQQAVYAAVRDLAAEAGPDPVGVTEIAARAGVHPATIYRRWRTAEALLLEVAVHDLTQTSPLTASGDLRTDLTHFAHTAAAGIARPGGLGFLRAIVIASHDPATGAEGATALIGSRLDQLQDLLDDDHPVNSPARRLDAIDVIDGLLAPIYFRALLSTPTTLTTHDIDRLVDNLITTAAHRSRAPGNE